MFLRFLGQLEYILHKSRIEAGTGSSVLLTQTSEMWFVVCVLAEKRFSDIKEDKRRSEHSVNSVIYLT